MVFSEKLTALLSLTATKNVAIAKALNIDTAQISRMKTGARGIPSNKQILQDIAGFIAGKIDSEYKVSALSELTGDLSLNTGMNEGTFANSIYNWLVSSEGSPETQAERFVSQFGNFSAQEFNDIIVEPKNIFNPDIKNGGFAVFYKNEGKREAVRQLIDYSLSLDKASTLRIFTDESSDWLLESNNFVRELSAAIRTFSIKGWRFQRIQPPILNTEGAFRAIEYWMSAYMTGSIKTYYYPWTRDELHRHTMFIIPGHLALYSASLYGERDSQMTFLVFESSLVAAVDEYFGKILERCRTMMTIYAADKRENLLERLNDIALINDYGVYKSSRLSSHTLPAGALAHIRKRASPFTQQLLNTYSQNERHRIITLRDYELTDIMCLPKLEDVINGIECVPGTKTSATDCLYYTPSEYRLHLKHILWYLDTFPNYHAILTDDPIQDEIVIYTKGDSRALMIKEAAPYTLFDITERTFASSLCNYLRSKIADKITPGSRQATINRILEEIKKIEEVIPMPQQM